MLWFSFKLHDLVLLVQCKALTQRTEHISFVSQCRVLEHHFTSSRKQLEQLYIQWDFWEINEFLIIGFKIQLSEGS